VGHNDGVEGLGVLLQVVLVVEVGVGGVVGSSVDEDPAVVGGLNEDGVALADVEEVDLQVLFVVEVVAVDVSLAASESSLHPFGVRVVLDVHPFADEEVGYPFPLLGVGPVVDRGHQLGDPLVVEWERLT